MEFSIIDVIVFVSYCLLIVGIGLYVSRDKKGHQKNAEDYFLAGKTLPWWAIGASLLQLIFLLSSSSVCQDLVLHWALPLHPTSGWQPSPCSLLGNIFTHIYKKGSLYNSRIC